MPRHWAVVVICVGSFVCAPGCAKQKPIAPRILSESVTVAEKAQPRPGRAAESRREAAKKGRGRAQAVRDGKRAAEPGSVGTSGTDAPADLPAAGGGVIEANPPPPPASPAEPQRGPDSLRARQSRHSAGPVTTPVTWLLAAAAVVGVAIALRRHRDHVRVRR